VIEELTSALVDLREDDALGLVDAMLAGGTDPLEIIEACRRGVEVIGKRFADGEAFIPELVMAGEIMRSITVKVKPRLKEAAPRAKLATIVVGTVQGDIHDIGKDIVVTMLDIAGFEVIDIGTDVPAAKFVDAARDHGASMIALSCLLTQAIASMKDTVEAVATAGLDGSVNVMVGGAPISALVCGHTGADGWGKDAVAAVELAKTWAEVR
jgi:5-methyltetrahydrofolate--homocysteine methyltransferase